MKAIIGVAIVLCFAGCGVHQSPDPADAAPVDAGTPDALSCSAPLWLADDAISRCTENGYEALEYTDDTVYRVTCTEYDEDLQCLTEWILEAPSKFECMTVVYDGVCQPD